MVEIERILSQRDRFILWTPILALLLVLAMEFSPFYQVEFYETDTDLSDGERTITSDFYDEYQHVHASSEDYIGLNQSSEYFEGSMQNVNEITDPDDEDYLGLMMVDVDSKLSTWLTISLILVLLIVVGTKEKIDFNKYVNHETINGASLAFISITSLFLIFSIIGYGSDFSDEEFGDIDDGDSNEFEYNDGFWGGIYLEYESSEGDVIKNEATWGPHIGFLFIILLFTITLIGSVFSFITLFEQFDVEQQPEWIFSNETSDKIAKGLEKLPSIMIAATVILAICSVFTPWYQIEQTWEGSHGSEENRTTHEFAWTLSPFIVVFDNQSGLDDKVAGEKSTSYDSYSEHPELENIAEPLLELKWPLICIFILCMFTVTKRMSSRITEAIEGEGKCWNTLFIAAIVISISLTNSAFEDGIFRKAEDDLDDISASYYTKPMFDGARDTNFGQQYTVVTNGSWWLGEDLSIYEVEITWANSIGAKFAQLSELIGLFAIALIWAPFTIRHINQTKFPKLGQEQLELWKGRPAIGVMISVLLITSLGGGVGELIASSESSAPKSIHKWNIDWENTNGNIDGSATMSDGESIEIKIDTSEFELGNVTFVGAYIVCAEGDQQSQFDTLDSLTWELTAPEGVNTSASSGTITCSNQNPGDDYAYWQGDWEFPSGEIYAQSSEEVLEMIKWISLGDGVWTLTLTASIGEDFSPIQDDDSCQPSWDIQLGGIDGVMATIDEE